MFLEKYPFVYLRDQAIFIGAWDRCKCKLSYEKEIMPHGKKKKKKKKTMKKSIRPIADSKKKSPSPMTFYHFFPHTMRQNILYCVKSCSFQRYCRQKILRLIVTVPLARGVRMFFFQFNSIDATAFQSLPAISVKNIAAAAFLL